MPTQDHEISVLQDTYQTTYEFHARSTTLPIAEIDVDSFFRVVTEMNQIRVKRW